MIKYIIEISCDTCSRNTYQKRFDCIGFDGSDVSSYEKARNNAKCHGWDSKENKMGIIADICPTCAKRRFSFEPRRRKG